jgi:putative ABC transport system permease protein
MSSTLADVRFALRLLRKAPGFTISVIAVLALGIGANASVFSALDQTVIRPLPYVDPDHLALLSEDFSAFGMPKNRVSPATFFDWKRRTRAFANLATWRVSTMNLSGTGAPEQVVGAAITANLLPLVGVPALAGRVLEAAEEAPSHRVVVLSERLWRRRFNADPALFGRPILMSGEPYTVVGVMPPGFHFPDARTDFWVPIALRPEQLTARNSHYLHVVGRLQPDVSWAAARDDMREIARQLEKEFPATNDRVGITVTPLKEEMTGDASRALLLLLGAAACVLLIACANVANLLLARASRRGREIAVRLALGAGRGRIVRQLLTESLLLSSAGGAGGLLVAHWSLQALSRFVPPALSATIDLHLDTRAVVFTALTTAATAVFFGMAPALQGASRSLSDSLKADAGTGGDRRGARLRHGLVIAEIAIALVLVVGAVLLVETLFHLRSVDPGFRADHVLTAEVVVPYPRYADAARRRQFYTDVLAHLKALPGVERAGLSSDLPYTSRANYMSLKVENQTTARGLGQDALFRLVSIEYLQTIGAKLRAGRFLDDRDRDGATPAVVINDALAREYWPHEDALGHRVDTGTGDGAPLWMTIVGVVEDIKERGLDYGPKPAVYVPYTQTTIAFFQPSEVAVRTTVPPESLSGALQRAVWAVDPEQPVSAIRTMDDIVDIELADRQQMLTLLGVFAAIALLLVTLGIYSVLSYLVSQSRREIGLRIAIGASPGAVIRGILLRSAGLTAIGIAVGLVAAFATTRWLGSLLFDVSPVDPAVLFSVSVLLAGVSLLASFAPARRAASVDPMIALRAD